MVWSSFKASLIGLLIAFVAILPPFVHLVTGPLGPAIGGFVAGGREKADFRIALVTGLFMGAFIGALGVVAIAIVWAVSKSIPQSGLQITAGDAVALSLAITTYATVMSTIGASLGGYIARKKDTSQPASGLEDRAGGG